MLTQYDGTKPDGAKHYRANKLARHRDQWRAAGYRPVQFWVLDTRSPDLAATLARQCRSLRDDPAEAEAIGFAQTAASLTEGWQ